MSETLTATHPVQTPFLVFQAKWSTLRGAAYGLREPVSLGQARAMVPALFDFGGLQHAMARFISEAVPDDLEAGSDAVRLVAQALHWAGALQREMRIPVFGRAYIGRARALESGGETMNLAAPYYEPRAASMALSWVAAAIGNFLNHGSLTPAGDEIARNQFDALAANINKLRPQGVNIYRFLAAAHDNKIPTEPVGSRLNCLRVGIGARGRWLQSSITDRTSSIGTKFAGNKILTANFIRRAGLPAPIHALVRSREEAVNLAGKLGYPVVVKPTDCQRGDGVAANLKSDKEVLSAYDDALKYSKNIMVEKHFDGIDYRMQVLNGTLFRVVGRLPGGVSGDGQRTIAELVKIAQDHPNHVRKVRERGGNLIELDREALELLAAAGLSPETRPEAGKYVRLRRRGNVSAGGTSIDTSLDKVHPHNRRLAERAVDALRLDVGGVDAIFPDIGKSWMETGALICEVNAQPQIDPRAADEFLTRLLDGDGRIPLVLVVGPAGCLSPTSLRETINTGIKVGFASTEGVWLGDERLTGPRRRGYAAAQILLDDRSTDAAVIIMSAGEILRTGLPVDAFDAMIIDSPAHWDLEESNKAADVLEIALPHARRVVLVDPVDHLLAAAVEAQGAAREGAGFTTVAQAFDAIAVEILLRTPQNKANSRQDRLIAS